MGRGGTLSTERLAELLRIGAAILRPTPDLRPADAAELRDLAEGAERMAVQLEAMAKRAARGGAAAPRPDDKLQ